MARTGDYVQKLANNIEDKLNLNRSDIKKMSRSEFKSLLKNAYFSQKRYIKAGYQEPTDRQLDVLDLHYGRPIKIKEKAIGASHQFFYKNHKNNKRVYINYVRRNKVGRLIDARTGRFVSKKR